MNLEVVDSRPKPDGVLIEISKARAEDIRDYATETANTSHDDLSDGEFAAVDRLIQLLNHAIDAIEDEIDTGMSGVSVAEEQERRVIVEADFPDVLNRTVDALTPHTPEYRVNAANAESRREYVEELVGDVGDVKPTPF